MRVTILKLLVKSRLSNNFCVPEELVINKDTCMYIKDGANAKCEHFLRGSISKRLLSGK